MPDYAPLLTECDAALSAAQLTPRDGAAAALCRRYARLIDDAASLAAELEVLWEEVDPEDLTARKHVAKMAAAVAAHTVASDLGPKLLAGLTALGCTLAGRGEKGTGADHAASPAAIALAGIRDEVGARRAGKAGRSH